ncbi:hypothetical protein PoB_006809000 [Plakobranchus ocellatus]|uniref:Uncharacterized protein n=1 Tax=Plakobranchus ocellatus TaxID=259542 RepID=A0AAV4DC15_9GAST|nr:hypothetical protein PoB_006809000 [Plakobranchus ocellatus]
MGVFESLGSLALYFHNINGIFRGGTVAYLVGRLATRPQKDDLRLSGFTSGQGASGGARTHVRGVPTDFRADSLATVPPTPRMLPG